MVNGADYNKNGNTITEKVLMLISRKMMVLHHLIRLTRCMIGSPPNIMKSPPPLPEKQGGKTGDELKNESK